MEAIWVNLVRSYRNSLTKHFDCRFGEQFFHNCIAQIQVRLPLKPRLKCLCNFCQWELTRLRPSPHVRKSKYVELRNSRKITHKLRTKDFNLVLNRHRPLPSI